MAPARRLFPAAILPRTCRPCSGGRRAPAASRPGSPGRTRASKERCDREGPPEPHGTRRTPGRQEGCGCASACDRLCCARDRHGGSVPVPSPPPPPRLTLAVPPCPRKHPRQPLHASGRVHATGRGGTKAGACDRRGACAYLPPGGRESAHAAPRRGPGIVALPDHPAGHWLPGPVTCCSQPRPRPLITWHGARSGTESGLHAQGERGPETSVRPLLGSIRRGEPGKRGPGTKEDHTYRLNFACPSRSREPSPLGAPRCTPGCVWRPSVCCRACREKPPLPFSWLSPLGVLLWCPSESRSQDEAV